MSSRKFIAQAPVICDRCGEMVKAGETAVAEFYSGSGKCRIRHQKCPESDLVRRNPRNPIRPDRVRAARLHKIHN